VVTSAILGTEMIQHHRRQALRSRTSVYVTNIVSYLSVEHSLDVPSGPKAAHVLRYVAY